MRIKRLIQISSAFLMVLALLVLFYTPARVSALAARSGFPLNSLGTTTSVNANVYLTNDFLQPMFQDTITQQIPQIVSATITTIVGQLPQEDQSWATDMAGVLLQPSATLQSLTPESDGLLTTLQLSLYQGDPKPQTLTILIGFNVLNATTIQVTALPIKGQQGFINGPLTTFKLPIGSLSSVGASVNCGDADLKINLKFPVSLGQQSQSAQFQPMGSGSVKSPLISSESASVQVASGVTSDIELPASSLAQLGSSIGTMKVSSTISAENIRIGVQGSNLTLTSDIYWLGIHIGGAVSTVTPGASNGNLVVHVASTNFQTLGGLVSFPMDNYNQQIEQTMNSEFSGALSGKFTVTQAAIGSNPHLPCAAADSLVLGGELKLS